MPALYRLVFLLGALCLSAACTPRGLTPDDLPTPIIDLDALATAQMMTQNAPPPRFREGIRFPRLDDNLDALDNWRAVISLDFDGVFAGTPRPARGRTTAEIWYNQLGNQRRVVLQTEGELLVTGQRQQLEGVRLGNDTYLVQDATCRETTDTAAAAVADLGAGTLIGGVTSAVPVGMRGRINGEEVYRYAFLQDALALTPSVQARDGGRVTFINGELWFSADHNAVVRFYLTLDVDNATVFGSQLPVSGQVVIRYDLHDIGINPNISVPFGC